MCTANALLKASLKCPLIAGNRAFAHVKLENFGSAIADADEAIRLDADYLKVRSISHVEGFQIPLYRCLVA